LRGHKFTYLLYLLIGARSELINYAYLSFLDDSLNCTFFHFYRASTWYYYGNYGVLLSVCPSVTKSIVSKRTHRQTLFTFW